MATVAERIHTLSSADLSWPYRGGPHYETRPRCSGTYRRNIEVDPFPCYAHDAGLVQEVATRTELAFPVPAHYQPNYYLLSHEDPGRTNGYATRDHCYNAEEKPTPWEGWIVLNGKRIPLHPAMTRYLTAHEYGHIVQYWIEHCREIKEEHPLTEFDREYARRRGFDPQESWLGEYGGGRWHKNIGELIANDFRILVAGVEAEFWPHPGFDRPEEVTGLADFWAAMVREYARE